ncbi:ATP-dependent zinc metalloprotease FtsH [Duncaniella freteri]|uniref:ATP-dependent zinc metalloprotease FtsH n=5 Tax=Duncaniella TaxID=2518495 RepID=UPI001367D38E|nr:ATP-dependent zinc metalloprotease FtsH [Duncaniella freteri]NBJ05900.1 ATP-dependent metallopeptidase FtsH/Yme1/Tma family protein [Alistipes sp. Z76]NCE67869.1 ATP-dependent metallopeptidase FtsH/Yme1/Tma family protein [Muribaculaceae bacterium M3]
MDTPNNKPKKSGIRFSMYWAYAIIIVFLLGMLYIDDNSLTKDVSYSKFEQYVESGGVKKITVFTNTNRAEAEVSDSLASTIFHEAQFKPGSGTVAHIITDIPSADKMKDQIDAWSEAGKFNGEVNYEKSSDYTSVLWTFGPIVLLVAFWFFMMRRMSGGANGGGPGGVFNVGKSKAKVFEKGEATNVTFKDVAGLTEPKTEIQEIVEFLRNPQRYTDLGGKIPKGALLVGPPGTGKTLLAKAVAGEANVPFFSMSGSDFVEMFVGVGASRVRDLFRQAKEKAPCIVFIDEIDAVGRARGKNPNMGANDERENTLNQLLTEMDGFGSNSGVIILAATNRADILDKALLRAGRFDRQITVDLPELKDRVEIFNVHLRNIKKDDTVDVEVMARQTAGFSGADIANVCNEAALIAARNNKKTVDRDSFMSAIDRIICGLEHSSKIISPEEKKAIAIHEAGHATVSWFLEYSNEMVKVSIVPRGMALGAAWYMPEERQITPLQALLDQMCMTLGGRAAEELSLGEISTGALNDLEKVTKMAYAIVVYYGMSEKLPNVCYYDSTGQSYGFSKPYGGERAKQIDEEVSRIISEQYERAKQIIRDHKEGHARLAETLLTKEVMYSEDLKEIFGERQWRSRTEEIMLLQAERDAAREAAKAAESKPDVEEEKENSSEPQDVVAVEVNPVEETKPQDDNDDSSVATPPPFKGV